MPRLNDAELYERGAKTLVASWEEYARGASGASVERLPGVAPAVFPHGPEREVYNNAIFDRGLSRGRRTEAIHAMERAYAAGGVSRFAAWVHEADLPMRRGPSTVTTGIAYDLDGDCGIYNIGTLERARRRGLGTALTALLVHDALGRGCTTASLQSTPIAERVYADVGFRALGRFLEYGR